MIIAEVGTNHGGNMGIAKHLIHQAKVCKADIVKFQLYDTDDIVPKNHSAYYDLNDAQLSRYQWEELVNECERDRIEFMASVFDVERVSWCESVNMKRYKIASRSIYNQPLIDAVLKTGKPMIVSLGKMDARGKPDLPAEYLYCVAKYPCPLSDLHLEKVDFTKYGFSDHTIGIEAAICAIARGARIVEKHFTLDKTTEGHDHVCSMEPDELHALVEFSKKWERMK